jgi:glycosyltransferase involved in cell wall biosynthesis
MNILLPTMTLDIGGAETHIVELAISLRKRGYKPVVVSSGGVYQKKLEESGIEVYNAPLDSKSPGAIIKSVKIMNKLIVEKNIELIHAHGRIPSLDGKISSFMTKIPMITTAHAKNTTSFVYKALTFWGEKVIAVSDDIKDHLVKNFNLSEDKITVITNGINMNTFIPKSGSEELVAELGLENTSKKILYISRLSGDLTPVVLNLIEAFVNIEDEMDLIIVGDGEDRKDIEFSVSKVNYSHKIKVLGKRTDIPELLAISDLVVAVSRSALEAMAMEKNVLLYGGEGYLGLYDKDIKGRGMKDNFTGRLSNDKIDAEILKNDIESFFKMEEEKRKMYRLDSREMVEEHYSLEKMVDKTIDFYNIVLKRR